MNESRVILVPNVPWLKSGTVKDNILFGSAYRREDYEGVIDACGLREDFKRLPLKDRVLRRRRLICDFRAPYFFSLLLSLLQDSLSARKLELSALW